MPLIAVHPSRKFCAQFAPDGSLGAWLPRSKNSLPKATLFNTPEEALSACSVAQTKALEAARAPFMLLARRQRKQLSESWPELLACLANPPADPKLLRLIASALHGAFTFHHALSSPNAPALTAELEALRASPRAQTSCDGHQPHGAYSAGAKTHHLLNSADHLGACHTQASSPELEEIIQPNLPSFIVVCEEGFYLKNPSLEGAGALSADWREALVFLDEAKAQSAAFRRKGFVCAFSMNIAGPLPCPIEEKKSPTGLSHPKAQELGALIEAKNLRASIGAIDPARARKPKPL